MSVKIAVAVAKWTIRGPKVHFSCHRCDRSDEASSGREDPAAPPCRNPTRSLPTDSFAVQSFGEKNEREFQLKLISSIDVWQTFSSSNEAPEEPIT